MSDTVIRVNGLWKQYQIGARQTAQRTLRETVADVALAPIRRLRAVGRGQAANAATDTFWALEDVSFSVQQGEVLGIIGRNGAGKSTLLKVLSRISEPTRGEIRLRGRVASLLEVGTGFHPELSGRDNVYLNGALLGMSRAEIRNRFDEIVSFAEVERFIDTPVKHYSSGMYVRLAFAVAAHLEPEVLIIDEVLAVGDIAFQRKCIGKMEDVALGNRTILLVSHSMELIRMLCRRTLWLDKGSVMMDAPTEVTLKAHAESIRKDRLVGDDNLRDRLRRTSGNVRFSDIKAAGGDGQETWTFAMGETVKFTLPYRVHADVPGLGLYLALSAAQSDELITSVKGVLTTRLLRAGESGTVEVELPNIALRPGNYGVYVALGDPKFERYHDVLDQNVSVPVLSITSTEQDHHLFSGWFSIPARVFFRPVGEISSALS